MTATELIQTTDINPVKLFSESGLDPILEEITEHVKSLDADLSTAKGRKEIASMAHKVAKSKTYLDELGKDLVAGQKATIKKVDGERKRMRDYLDNLKAEVRKPLTEWEEAEQRLQDQKEATKRAEREADDKANRALKDAIQAERDRQAEEKRREEAETARREKDRAHKGKINREALAALKKGGVEPDQAKLVVELIAKKMVANVTIIY